MATTASRRTRKGNVTPQMIEQVGTLLRELPEKPKEKLLLREAVDQLQDQIKAALAKGYNYDEVAAMLTNQGIEISPATLKRYVPAGRGRSAKRQTTATGTRTRRSRQAESDASAADVSPDQANDEAMTNSSAAKTSEDTAKPAQRRGQAAKSKAEPSAVTTEPEATEPESKPSGRGRSRRTTASEDAAPKRKTTRSTTRSSASRRRK